MEQKESIADLWMRDQQNKDAFIAFCDEYLMVRDKGKKVFVLDLENSKNTSPFLSNKSKNKHSLCFALLLVFATPMLIVAFIG